MSRISSGVKRIREKLRWTQEDLSRKLGISVREIARWENGYAEPSNLALRQLRKLAKKVGVREL